ncbi:MAG: hypothetical protein HY428_02640 [Candidatus Levybacteria bacterium]|nr:hypothetical protein [Candidatus Levybacteria bacterium]
MFEFSSEKEYNKFTLPVITPPVATPKCSKCQSDLILLNTETISIEHHRFPVIVTTYRCSNSECQEETDKKTAARLKNIRYQELARLQREKTRLEGVKLKREQNRKTAKGL